MKKAIIVGIVFLILFSVLVTAEISDTTAVMRDLNERLERNKAELIKEIKDTNKKNEELIGKSIDDNFGVLDTRINDFFKGATRDIAIIMVAGFMAGFTLSRIVGLKIEQMRRKALVKRSSELEIRVDSLGQEALKLTKIVRGLQAMDNKYSQHLDSMKPQRFLNPKTILVGWVSFLVGAGLIYIVVGL